jgi:hypothetical protein
MYNKEIKFYSQTKEKKENKKFKKHLQTMGFKVEKNNQKIINFSLSS